MKNTKKKAPVKKTSATKPATKRTTTEKCVNTQKKPVKKNNLSVKKETNKTSSKGKNKQVKKVKGFVMNRKTGHTSYAYKQKGVSVKSIGFTHNKNDKAEKAKLKHNINPKDDTDCYVKIKVEKQKYNTYRKKQDYKDYRLHKDDKPKIDRIIMADEKAEKNKKRR